MAADKEIMKAIETLRLDRPGMVYAEGAVAVGQTFGPGLIAALAELARTYREEAELWSRSGAKGWKGSEAEKYLVAQHIDDVAAQLDNAGGGAALSVSEPRRDDVERVGTLYNEDGSVLLLGIPRGDYESIDAETRAKLDSLRDVSIPYTVDLSVRDAALEAELRESAKRVDAVRDLAGLDALIADSVAQRKGMVRDELLPDGHPARSDAADADFCGPKEDGGWTCAPAHCDRQQECPLSDPDDVTAYLKGETNDIPGSAPLTPGSVTSAPESDDPFAREMPTTQLMLLADQPTAPEFVDPAVTARLAALPDFTATMTIHPITAEDIASGVVPITWESETMTADGHRPPGLAPLLGQPGDAGSGYSHSYIPAGGRRFTYAELLTPVPAASLPAHLSHSQGNTIGDCGVKYRLQRIEGLPQVPQWANVGGSAFHAAVEAFERTVGGMADHPGGIAAAQESKWAGYDCELVWKHHFEEQIRMVSATSPVPVSVWRAARKGAEGRQWWEVNGPLMLRRYLDARPNRNPITIDSTGTPAIEWEVKADVPTGYGPVPFVAKLDSVKLSADGTAVVIEDYKTSYERPTDTTQLGEYAHMLLLSGANLHGATRILGTYFDARRGEWTEPVDLLAAHPFEAFQYDVTSRHAQKRALTTGPTPARPSSYCGGCSVRYACPIMSAKS